MATKPRQSADEKVPDPSDVYERSHPEHEAGMGRLDNNAKATPAKRADKLPTTVKNAQDGSRQLNAHDDLQLPQSPAKKVTGQKPDAVGWDPEKDSPKKRKK